MNGSRHTKVGVGGRPGSVVIAALRVPGTIAIESEVEVHPLEDGNEVLRRIETGAVAGAAVLTMDEGT